MCILYLNNYCLCTTNTIIYSFAGFGCSCCTMKPFGSMADGGGGAEHRSSSVAELRRKAQEHSAALFHSLQHVANMQHHAAAAAALQLPVGLGLQLPSLTSTLHALAANRKPEQQNMPHPQPLSLTTTSTTTTAATTEQATSVSPQHPPTSSDNWISKWISKTGPWPKLLGVVVTSLPQSANTSSSTAGSPRASTLCNILLDKNIITTTAIVVISVQLYYTRAYIVQDVCEGFIRISNRQLQTIIYSRSRSK